MADEQLNRLREALADRYRIQRELGRGGMATVYLAEDLKHQRRVALKVLRPDLAATLGADRFLQEVRVTANLQHPHILPLFDSGEAGGFLFYAMPFIDGESLRDRLVRERELPVVDAARVLRDVTDALATAHKAGVVHRDIKPENILLTGRHALVADFGVAKAVSEATGRHQLTTAGVALGTPYYMAPEQAAGDSQIDHRADIYAVGAMAYELVTGQPPFTGNTPQAILTAQVTKAPAPVTDQRPSVPPAFASLIMRCLEKRPADRWQTAEEMLPYLEATTTPSGGVTPTDTLPVTATAMPASRVPRRAVAAVVVIVIGLAVLWAVKRFTGSAAGGATLDSLRVVVLPFENRTGDPAADVWGEMIADAATRMLAQRAQYLDVPAQGSIRPASLTNVANLAEVASQFGARYALAGRYAQIGAEIQFDAELFDAETGQQAVAIDPVLASPDSVRETVALVAERAAVAAAAHARPNQGAISMRGFHPPSSFESLDLIYRGNDAFCRQDYNTAMARYEGVFERDPAFTGARLYGLATYGNGGRGTLSADSILALVREAEPRMTQIERAVRSWMNPLGDRRWEQRLAAARELDQIEYAFNSPYAVVFAALPLNRLDEALDASRRLALEDPCLGQWSPVWSARTTSLHLTGRHDEELAVARRAADRFPANIGSIRYLGSAAAAGGQVRLVDSVVEMLAALPANAAGVVDAIIEVANELEVHGYPDDATRIYRQAYDSAVAQSPEGSLARSSAALRALPASEALPVLEAAAESFPNNTGTLGRLALNLVRLDRASEADSLVDRIWQISAANRWPAAVAAARGDGRGAAAALRRALDAGGFYFYVGNRFLHSLPEFVAIRDDPSWQAIMAPRE